MMTKDEKIKNLPPDRRAIYERIKQIREEIGPVYFNVVNGLRELRNCKKGKNTE